MNFGHICHPDRSDLYGNPAAGGWVDFIRPMRGLGQEVRLGYVSRLAGCGWPKRSPSSHASTELPPAGKPPLALSHAAVCMRFQAMKVTFFWVNSVSGPPEPSSK